MRLSLASFSLPGSTWEERLAAASRAGVGVELALQDHPPTPTSLLESVRIETVQARGLRSCSLVHRDENVRRRARKQVQAAIGVAKRLGASKVLTVVSYGHEHLADSLGHAVDLFRKLALLAEPDGIELLIEPLSPRRTSCLATPRDVARLIEKSRQPNLAMLVDTLHTLETGLLPQDVLAEFGDLIGEVHLRDTGSRPPGQGKLDWPPIYELLREKPDRVLCVETAAPLNEQELSRCLSHVAEGMGRT